MAPTARRTGGESPTSTAARSCARGHSRAALAVGVAVLLALAGCQTGGQATPVAAAGSPVELPESAVDDAGYEHVATTERTLNATLRAELEGDISVTEVQDVRATVPVARYRRATPDGPAVVAVAASPSVRLVENPPIERDPLGTLSTPELVAFVQPTYRIDANSAAGSRDVTVAGNRTEVVTYAVRANGSAMAAATATPPVQPEALLTVRVVRVDYGDDVLSIVSVTPRARDARLGKLLDAVPDPG